VSLRTMLSLRQCIGEGEDSEESETEGDDREHLIVPPIPVTIPDDAVGKPERALPLALSGRGFDMALALKIASSLRKKKYSLAHFYEDVRAAFPELDLYLAMRSDPAAGAIEDHHAVRGVTSGLTSDEEYRRTIGAMFAVYWLVRIGIDGERGFSFGVDESWQPKEPPDLSSEEVAHISNRAELEKRLSFYKAQDWRRLQQLLTDSGILIEVGGGGRGGGNAVGADTGGGGSGQVQVNPERAMAMLALTAFHDVMKVEALLPKVAKAHAPYLTFQAGDVIHDHDLALGYVLTHCGQLLPSFSELSTESQKSIRFTQSKMRFNHGWLVQGEAPPAPLFGEFKQVLQTEHVAPADVAFYFVHWLTDLAGAEPSPLGGAEKLVLKFPHAVLDSFIRSFAVINELAIKSETTVMEEYLVRTWAEQSHLGALGGLAPRGEDAVALMRLSLQAQTPDKQEAVLHAWSELSFADRSMLTDEMARSGIEGQIFDRGPAFKQVFGPTFLVYYSPAFVRNLALSTPLECLRILAEVYRRARDLWPLRPTVGNAHSVTIRVDQLKELKLSAITSAYKEGQSWIICRKNDTEGVVEKHEVSAVAELGAKGVPTAILKLWTISKVDKNGGGSDARSGTTVNSAGGSHKSRGSKDGSRGSKDGSRCSKEGSCSPSVVDSQSAASSEGKSGRRRGSSISLGESKVLRFQQPSSRASANPGELQTVLQMVDLDDDDERRRAMPPELKPEPEPKPPQLDVNIASPRAAEDVPSDGKDVTGPTD